MTGFSRTTAYVSSLDAGRTPANRLSNPYPTGLLDPVGSSLGLSTALGTNINYHIRDREIPEYHQYSIGVQRQLPWRSVIDVSFVGSATRKRAVSRPVNDLSREQILLGDAYLNTLVPNPFVGLMPDAGATNTAATVQRRVLMRPLPQFGTINEQLVPIGYGNYSSLQVSWEKRRSQGVQLLVGYTGSRTTEAPTPTSPTRRSARSRRTRRTIRGRCSSSSAPAAERLSIGDFPPPITPAEGYFVGTMRFSSSVQFCTKIIWAGAVGCSFLTVIRNRCPSGATS